MRGGEKICLFQGGVALAQQREKKREVSEAALKGGKKKRFLRKKLGGTLIFGKRVERIFAR